MDEKTELAVLETEKINSLPAIQNVFQSKEAFEQLTRFAVMLSKASIVPDSYQGKPENCFIALDMANRMKLSPLVVMQNLFVIKGKPGWSGQACKMLVENCSKFTDIKHVYTGEKGTPSYGCYLQGTRISDGECIHGPEVTIEMATKEGWMSNAKWKNLPDLMLAYRASAFFARVHVPESLMGLHLVEEIEDTVKEKVKVVNPLG
jgi:hypothetical protein